MMTMNMNMNGVEQGMMQYPEMCLPQETTKVAVSVKNMTCNYRLTADDLTTVFSRFGKLAHVNVGQVDSSQATIEFVDYNSAVKCVESLNGKILSGEKGTLVVSLLDAPQNVYSTNNFSTVSTPEQSPMPSQMHFPQAFPQMQPVDYTRGFNTPPMQQSPAMPYASPPRFMVAPQMQQQQVGQFQQQFNNGFPQQDMGMHAMDFNNQQMPNDYMGHVASRLPQQMQQQQHMGMMMHQNDEHHMEQPRPRRIKKQNSGNLDNSPSRVRKFTCRFDVGIQNERIFQVARRIIGSKGANMKKIFKDTGAKLRLRGQGSGFLEGTSQQESPEALHLCVSAKKIDEYQLAVRKIEELLQGVYREYRAHCKQKDLATPNLRVVCREHPLVTMHRNAMKAKAAKEGVPDQLPTIDESMIVADANQPIDSAPPSAMPSPSASPLPSRKNSNSEESLGKMVEHAKAHGSDREVALLRELMALRSRPNSRAPSVRDDNETTDETVAEEAAAAAPAVAA